MEPFTKELPLECAVELNRLIELQMEGSIGYGLGAVMRNEITMTKGIVDQTNFPQYVPLRMSDMPNVDVHIMPSDEKPSGAGEPSLPPAGPALANAITSATGKRITHLPMNRHGIKFA